MYNIKTLLISFDSKGLLYPDKNSLILENLILRSGLTLDRIIRAGQSPVYKDIEFDKYQLILLDITHRKEGSHLELFNQISNNSHVVKFILFEANQNHDHPSRFSEEKYEAFSYNTLTQTISERFTKALENFELIDRAKNSIEIELSIPDHLSDEAAKKYVKDLVIQMDDTHRALGGSGLKLDDLEALEVFSTQKVDA